MSLICILLAHRVCSRHSSGFCGQRWALLYQDWRDQGQEREHGEGNQSGFCEVLSEVCGGSCCTNQISLSVL